MLLSPLPEQKKKKFLQCKWEERAQTTLFEELSALCIPWPGSGIGFRAQAEKMQLALHFEDDPKALMPLSGVFPVSSH